MTVLKVPERHCENCVKRITHVLNDAGLDFEVSLEDKTVAINGCENCVKTAVEELDDIGFSAEEK